MIMWKVEIKKVHQLYEFTYVFLQDLFKWALNNKGVSLENVQESIKEQRLYCLAKECPKLRERMFKLAECSDLKEVFQMYKEFISNYERVLKGNFQSEIQLEETTFKIVKNAFEYFYEDMLDLKSFWRNYKNGEYKTKNEYREEIGAIRHRCPYCDVNRITSADYSNIDHFLPMYSYPFLSVFWKNLIVSCISCNTLVKNKAIMLPILHPFFDRIQDEIFFTFNMENKVILINAKDNGFGSEAAENYCKVFRLEKNYSKLWHVIDREEGDIISEITKNFKRNETKEIEQIVLETNKVINDREKIIYSQIAIDECTKLKIDFYKFYRGYSSVKIKKFMLLEQQGINAFQEMEV
ncbi:HNH endonuclease family protein [Bacillus mycoides]|uniref:hypothetical protein n=1 Tax=Bacillus mycoides TaxID=1405 RepID=UPI000B446D97|nr:hypothetical protein [Bacillus mycoides]